MTRYLFHLLLCAPLAAVCLGGSRAAADGPLLPGIEGDSSAGDQAVEPAPSDPSELAPTPLMPARPAAPVIRDLDPPPERVLDEDADASARPRRDVSRDPPDAEGDGPQMSPGPANRQPSRQANPRPSPRPTTVPQSQPRFRRGLESPGQSRQMAPHERRQTGQLAPLARPDTRQGWPPQRPQARQVEPEQRVPMSTHPSGVRSGQPDDLTPSQGSMRGRWDQPYERPGYGRSGDGQPAVAAPQSRSSGPPSKSSAKIRGYVPPNRRPAAQPAAPDPQAGMNAPQSRTSVPAYRAAPNQRPGQFNPQQRPPVRPQARGQTPATARSRNAQSSADPGRQPAPAPDDPIPPWDANRGR
ncbi:MAG: hypothetical protein WD063_13530 [Pirellulales bacterium]